MFCRRLYDACKLASRMKSKRVCLNAIVRDDINWWKKFSVLFNGKAAIQPNWSALKITTDSSLKGFAAYTTDDWICGTWCDQISMASACNHIVSSPQIDVYDPLNINVLELCLLFNVGVVQ